MPDTLNSFLPGEGGLPGEFTLPGESEPLDISSPPDATPANEFLNPFLPGEGNLPGEFTLPGEAISVGSPNYYIELWRSFTGTADADFNLITIISEVDGPSSGWGFDDLPLAPNHYYYYRARRQEISTGLYSDWSSPVLVLTLRSGDTQMGFTPTGARTLFGIGLQPMDGSSVFNNFGGACKITDLLEYRSGFIESDRPSIFSEALKDTPSGRHKSVTGDFGGKGAYDVDMTPAGGFSKMIVALFGAPTTTPALVMNITTTLSTTVTVASTTGIVAGMPIVSANVPSGSVVVSITDSTHFVMSLAATLAAGPTTATIGQPYTHVFKNAWDYRLVTAAQKIGNTLNVYPDSLVDSMRISAQRRQGGVMSANFGVMPGNRFIAATQAAIGMDVAGYDTGLPYAPAKVKIFVNGAMLANFSDLNLDYSRQAEEKYAFGGKLGPSDFILPSSNIGAALTGYFDSEYSLSQFMGQDPATVAKPFGFTDQITQVTLEIRLEQTVGVYTYSASFYMPKCNMNKVSEPVQGRNAIMQPISFEPCYDTTSATDLITTLVNGQANGSLMTYGATITPPANAVF